MIKNADNVNISTNCQEFADTNKKSIVKASCIRPKVNNADITQRQDLITQLIQLLELDWSQNKQTNVLSINENSVMILPTKVFTTKSLIIVSLFTLASLML